MVVGARPIGVSWLVAVGLTKLTLAASAGLMASGAVFLRLHRRHEERRGLVSEPSFKEPHPEKNEAEIRTPRIYLGINRTGQ